MHLLLFSSAREGNAGLHHRQLSPFQVKRRARWRSRQSPAAFRAKGSPGTAAQRRRSSHNRSPFVPSEAKTVLPLKWQKHCQVSKGSGPDLALSGPQDPSSNPQLPVQPSPLPGSPAGGPAGAAKCFGPSGEETLRQHSAKRTNSELCPRRGAVVASPALQADGRGLPAGRGERGPSLRARTGRSGAGQPAVPAPRSPPGPGKGVRGQGRLSVGPGARAGAEGPERPLVGLWPG